MTVSQEWRGSIRSLEFGAGTSYPIGPTGIGGLGLPVPRTFDQARGDRDGMVASRDLYDRRVLSIALTVLGDTASADLPGDAMTNLRTLKTAFAREETLDEVELELRVPGFPGAAETLTFFGRPRGLEADLSKLAQGVIPVLATFVALDPLGYEPEAVEATGASGAFTVDNDGDEDTDRVVIEVTGNGGTPRITNATDGGGDVTFGTTLAALSTRTIDLRAHTVEDGGSDHYDELSSASTWFVLKPGTNSLTLTGAASVDVTVRAAHG